MIEKGVKVGTVVMHVNIGHMSCFLTGIILPFICICTGCVERKEEEIGPNSESIPASAPISP